MTYYKTFPGTNITDVTELKPLKIRFRYKQGSSHTVLYLPYYLEDWTFYDATDTSRCHIGPHWPNIWHKDKRRDIFHKKHSFYYSSYFDEDDGTTVYVQDTPTLAFVLFAACLFCIFLPQLMDMCLTKWCPRPPRPPTPPSPPPPPSCRKRLRLFHYAQLGGRKWAGKMARKSIVVGRDKCYYDPEDIFNYVSVTRFKAVENYESDDGFGNKVKKKSHRSLLDYEDYVEAQKRKKVSAPTTILYDLYNYY